jgi:hypothetical protein
VKHIQEAELLGTNLFGHIEEQETKTKHIIRDRAESKEPKDAKTEEKCALRINEKTQVMDEKVPRGQTRGGAPWRRSPWPLSSSPS